MLSLIGWQCIGKDCRKDAEKKASERVTQHEGKVYCPGVEVGQIVYLRHRPLGRNKIQDVWSPVECKVVEVQGFTYTVQPLGGGLVKRVHRSNLRPCVSPSPVPRPRCSAAPSRDDPIPILEPEEQFHDPQCVLVEEVRDPREGQMLMPMPGKFSQVLPEPERGFGFDVERPTQSEAVSGSDSSDASLVIQRLGPASSLPELVCVDLPAEEVGSRPVPIPRKRVGKSSTADVPSPAPRRTLRETAGVYSNPHNLPKPACKAVSFSPDVLSQVLAGMVFYTSGRLRGMLDE